MQLSQAVQITTTTDSYKVAHDISTVAAQEGVTIRLLIEVDTGLHRVGLAPGEPVLNLAQEIRSLPSVEIVGLLAHAGQVHKVKELSEVPAVAREEGEVTVRTAALLREAGIPVQEISVGTSPTARHVAAVPGVTEIRPGTYIYNDCMQMAMGVASVDTCALTVLATVVSRPVPDRAVIDAGTKALTSDKPGHGRVPGHGYVKGYGYERVVIYRLHEEHGVLSLKDGADLQIGQKLEIIPSHACPVVNLFDEFVGTRGDRIEGVFPVAARGKTR